MNLRHSEGTGKEEWVKIGSYGNSDMLAKGNKRKLVDRSGKLADFHYEIKEVKVNRHPEGTGAKEVK